MLPRCHVFASLVAVTLFLACAAVGLGAPPTDEDLRARVDSIAAEALRRPGAVGLSVGVARGGRVALAAAYGLADAEFEVPANKDTMFRIGSVTKQFTAAAIMRLIEQGKLSLDDDLSRFLPDFPLQGGTVTVRQLLNHTSGIPSYTELGAEWEKVQPLELSHDEMLALVRGKPFSFKPGEKWAYNNTGYYILGMIIEKVTGVAYAKYVQDELFTPLKLGRTRYDSSRDLMKNRAQGYSLRDGQLVNDAPLGMSQPFAAGSLVSTGEDLVVWSMALAAGKVVSAESCRLMTTPTVLPDGTATHYGFGLQIEQWEGRPCIRHGGGIFGFNSMLMHLPGDDLHVAVISNGEPLSSAKVAGLIAEAALGIERAATRDEPVSPELMSRIVGKYSLEAIGMECTIWAEDGKAMLKASGEGQSAFVLLWQGQGGNEFRASFDDSVRIVFADDGRSFTLFQGGRQTDAKRVDP